MIPMKNSRKIYRQMHAGTGTNGCGHGEDKDYQAEYEMAGFVVLFIVLYLCMINLRFAEKEQCSFQVNTWKLRCLLSFKT